MHNFVGLNKAKKIPYFATLGAHIRSVAMTRQLLLFRLPSNLLTLKILINHIMVDWVLGSP